MSQEQSNKRGNIIFKILWLLIIVLAAEITYVGIKKHNDSLPKDIVVEEPPKEEETTKPFLSFNEVVEKNTINAFKTYPVNPIVISFEKGRVFIDGLKNNEIEVKVNNILKSLDSTKDINGTDSCYINFNVSNVLSITCKGIPKNIDLTSGNEIKLEEIFNKDTNIQEIIIKSVYSSYCIYGNCTNIEIDEDANNLENETINALTKIKNGDYKFDINYAYIDFPGIDVNYDYLMLNYYDFYDSITIFDRFLTEENIYEKEVTDSCNPSNCNTVSNTPQADDYSHELFLNDHNYLEMTVYNTTDRDISYSLLGVKKNFNMEEFGKKLEEEIINKHNLKDASSYHHIYAFAEIFDNGTNGYQVSYSLTINETDSKSFPLYLMGSRLVESKETRIEKGNLIIDSNTNISYLDETPSAIFNNFESKLYNYIMNDLENEDSVFKGYKEYEKEKDYHELIRDASYAVDPINKRIYMLYNIYAEFELESHVSVLLSFSIFE